MISIRQLALFVASAAALVSASPSPEPAFGTFEPRALDAREPFGPDHEMYFDARTITDASDPRLQKRNGQLNCGNFAAASYGDAHTLVQNMGTHGGDQYTIQAHGCYRVACRNTSAVYVCNDRNAAMTLNNDQISDHCDTILQKCCIHNALGQWDDQHQSGGQQFTDALGGNWNVIIGYGNCGHPVDRKPDTYANSHPQVNGLGCLGASMYIS